VPSLFSESVDKEKEGKRKAQAREFEFLPNRISLSLPSPLLHSLPTLAWFAGRMSASEMEDVTARTIEVNIGG